MVKKTLKVEKIIKIKFLKTAIIGIKIKLLTITLFLWKSVASLSGEVSVLIYKYRNLKT